MSDVIIVGSGPAGISASLYTVRANISTAVISSSEGALLKTDKIENYYGFPDAISGKELTARGIDGAKRLGVEFFDGEVVSIDFDGKFTVTAADKEYSASAVLLATGSRRIAPQIDGIQEFEGKGVSYCAVCDAFFYRGKDVAVLGSGEYALHEAEVLLRTAKSVTILTNSDKPTAHFPKEIKIIKKKISHFSGESKIQKVVFEDKSEISLDGLFIAYGVAGTAALAKKLGAITNGSEIKVNENMMTTVPGLFAAGDCTGGLLQISKAVYEGAMAGTQMIKYIRKK